MPDTTAHRRHFAPLDGYRGLAAMLVVLCHASLISGLNGRLGTSLGPYLARADIGVAIFFLLSGFLIYRPFVRARLARQPMRSTASYFRRRALRILPAYWVALAIVGFVMQAPGFEDPHSIVMHFLLIHVYDVTQVIGGPIQQSWSLATEISFYLAIPFYAAALGIGREARSDKAQYRFEMAAVTAVIVGSVLLKLGALAAGISATRMGQFGTFLPWRMDAFGLGMGMAVVSAWFDHTGTRGPALLQRRWFPAACFVLSGFTFWAVCTQFGLPLGPIFTAREAFIVQVLYALSAFFLLLPGVFGPERQGLARRVLSHPMAVWIGLVSYGIYIWHEAWLFKWFQWTGSRELAAPFWQVLTANLVLTIPIAAASYYLVERPLLRFRARRT